MIYHILFRPAIDYNTMLIPFRNKNFSEFVIIGQFKHLSKSRIESLKQSFILVLEILN